MLDMIETVMLRVLPISFAVKSLALMLMWAHLRFETTPLGPLGEKINLSFRETFIMSVFLTWVMTLIAIYIDSSEIHWPVTSLAITACAIWPLRTAWAQWRVYYHYRNMDRLSRTARDKRQDAREDRLDNRSVTLDERAVGLDQRSWE